MSKPLVCVFTRVPAAGKTKTRLAPVLGDEGAAVLQRRMGEHALRQLAPIMRTGNVAVEVHYTGGEAGGARDWLGPEPDYHQQGGGSMGERLARSFSGGFSRDHDPVMIIGTDCPDLGSRQLQQAIDLLDESELVLGPAADGGYYLIGITASTWSKAQPRLFTGIDWGTDEVLTQTLAVAEELEMPVRLLEVLTDVDRPSDLHVWERWCGREPGTVEVAKSASPEISVIIPALEEEDIIGKCIEQLAASEDIEIIVADGGSTDETRAIAAANGAVVVDSEPGRARQMNAGAAGASGKILLFLHSDTRLPAGFDHMVHDAIYGTGAIAGAFEFATDIDSRIIRIIEKMTDVRSRRLGITFGDQALFVKADCFRQLGGYPLQPIMEDYELVRRLRRSGSMVIVPRPAVTSARRWRANGVIKNTFINVSVTIAYLLRFPTGGIYSFYRRMNGGYRV